LMKVRPGAPVKAQEGSMEQFASGQLDMTPVVNARHEGGAGN
jgi:hypothetical protein